MAEALHKLNQHERVILYRDIDEKDLASLITEVSIELQEEIITTIDNLKLKKVLENMSDDDIVDIFGELSEDEVKNLMKLLGKEEREEVKKLSKHEKDTAGGLMTTDFFCVNTGTKIKEIISTLKEEGNEVELIYYVYINDKNTGKLVGVASLKEIIISDDTKNIEEIMEENVISVSPETDQEKVAYAISKYDLLAIPVIDSNERIMGIITVDDIIDVIEEEATEDIYTMAGLAEEDVVEEGRIASSVKIRLPWILISLFGELLSAKIMHTFGGTLEKLVALAFFVPLIMAMGGNSGSQSSAVMVRKIALGEAEKDKLKKIILKESTAGIILGLISSAIVFSVAYSAYKNIVLAMIIAFALLIAISWAAFFGTITPIIFSRYKIDPAAASGPFITTLNDIGGILIYFGLAALLMKFAKV